VHFDGGGEDERGLAIQGLGAQLGGRHVLPKLECVPSRHPSSTKIAAARWCGSKRTKHDRDEEGEDDEAEIRSPQTQHGTLPAVGEVVPLQLFAHRKRLLFQGHSKLRLQIKE